MLRDIIKYDLEGSNATDSELNALLDEAYVQTCWDVRMPVASEQVSVPALTERVVLTNSIQRVYECHWKDAGGTVSKMWPWAAGLDTRLTWTGKPQYYIPEGNSIRLMPIPDTAGYVIVSGVKVSTLGSDTAEPELPKHLHPAIVYYAASRWAERYGHQKATYFMSRYKDLTRTGEHIRQQLHAYRGELR